MKLIRHFMYKRYVPYARLVEEKKAQGLWGNTWGVKVDENDPDEGVKFELVGCPLAAKRSRELVPSALFLLLLSLLNRINIGRKLPADIFLKILSM